ncbi:protein AATF-like [Rhopilema esculentum]|uniref:protein AATF-like n=1 Tax=Rhopilema esculentum TaxID=499914 RepID=UPI0031DFFA3D
MASIREQLRELENPKPGSFDPEDDAGSLTAARVITNFKETGNDQEEEAPVEASVNLFGSLRKRANESLISDHRYKGVKVSRSELQNEEGLPLRETVCEGESESENEDDYGPEENDDDEDDDLNDADDFDNDSDDYVSDCDVGDGSNGGVNSHGFQKDAENDDAENRGLVKESLDQYEDESMEGEQSAENQLLKLAENDALKGKAVSNQLGIWEKFLEIRIKLQRCVQFANKYPQGQEMKDFEIAGGPDVLKMKKDVRRQLVVAIDELLSLQSKLFSSDKTIASQDGIKTGAEASDEEIDSDTDIDNDEKLVQKQSIDKSNGRETTTVSMKKTTKLKQTIAEYEKEVSNRHKSFQPFVDETIAKWDEKTKTSYGKQKNRNFSSFDRSIIKQITQIMSEKERLIKRTQLKRSIYRTLGKKYQDNPTEEAMEDVDLHLKNYDPEIFDDDDFYHQLLKEFIERKSNILATDDPVSMGRQWLEIQKLRSKVKKKIDSKASKGRRIRYDVHSKLLNFMAPVSVGSMNDQSRNDLFKSLFGASASNGQ